MAPVRGLRVHLLGGLEVEGRSALSLGSRKARTLLRRLAIARSQPVPVDELLTALWPASTARHPQQLSVLASRLRRVIGPERLVRNDVGYLLRPDWLDVVALEQAMTACEAALALQQPARARRIGLAALELVLGPLLPEEPDAPWLEAERLLLDRRLTHLRLLTAEAALGSGAPRETVELARRCRDADPFDELALRLVLRGLAASGQVAAALSTYLAALAQLRAELGTGVSRETEELYLALLRDGRVPTP